MTNNEATPQPITVTEAAREFAQAKADMDTKHAELSAANAARSAAFAAYDNACNTYDAKRSALQAAALSTTDN